MFRAFWVGILCVAVPPVGIGLAVWLLLRDPGEVSPEAPKRRRPIIMAPDGHAMCPCALVEAEPVDIEPLRSDWSKIKAYTDDL